MAASMNISVSYLIPAGALPLNNRSQHRSFVNPIWNYKYRPLRSRASLQVRAAKLPSGVELPKVQPKFEAPFLGFTKTAEMWNSRACMIGLIGTFVVELTINRGILQVIGVEVAKGLNLPL